MAAVHVFLLLQFILSLVLQSSALMSDYKTCGDDACARLMCRVQAVRDHHAQDCRFLSFKKGDMIDVYHKLARKRSDLWAGSTDKEFGYFPKDAVKIDEVFVDEKKEIEMSTQKTDFFCMDAFGTIIASSEEFDDYEFGDQTAESEELGNSDFDDRVSKASETNDNVEMRHVDNDNKDRGKPEQSGSSWIGSTVSGWFANDADEAGNGNKEQEKFKSRKLALDLDQLDEDQLDEVERQTKILDWIGDGLTNTFGFGKNDLQANSKDETENNEDLPNDQSSYLLGNGIKNALGFGRGGGGDTPPSETKKLSLDENMQNLREQQEAMSLKAEDLAETITENKKIGDKKDAGWYNSVYNRITNFYGEPSDKSEASKDEGKESLSDQGMDVDKVMISKDEKNPELRSESSQRDRNPANQDEKQEVKIQDQSGETSQLGEAWYGSVYNRITGFYGDTPDGNAGDALDKSEVIENGRGDPQVTSETEDVRSSRDEKLDNTVHTAENNNAGWYDTVYSRISDMYGDTSDKNDIPDGMKDVESQAQSENTKDTSSPSMFSMNGLSEVIDSLRSPSKGAGSDDETTLSETITSEPSLTQSHVSSDQSDVTKLSSDDEDSELTEKENTDNITDIDQSQDTSQSIFSVNRLSMMINSLKSPFKPHDAGDKEESDGEKTSDTGKEGQNDNDDESDNDDELSVRLTDGISEISTQRAALGSEQEEEEEVVQEVNVAEAQINTVESSLDCNKQDMGGDGEKISTDISTNFNDIHADIDEFNDHSDSGSAHLSTGQSKNMTSVLNTDETETLTEEPGWTELAQHANDTSKSREGDASTSDDNKSIPEKDQFTDIPGEEEPQSESETGSDSGLQVRTDVLENNSETVDETDEAQDEGEAADMLPETEEADMKVRRSETAQTIHTASNDEKHGVDVTQMEYGREKESGDATQIKYSGENKSVNITLMEYDEEREGDDIIEMDHRGKKEGDDIKGIESAGEKEGGVTQMGYSGGQEDVDVAQMESDGEKEDINATQMETDGEKESLKITQMESGGEKEGGATQMEYSGEQEDVDVAQMESDGEKEDINATQMETDGEKESLKITQMESGGEKEGGATQMEYSGEQEDVDVAQMESDGEKEDINATQMETDGEKESLKITQMESGEEKEGGATQMEYSGEQEDVDVAQMESDGEKEDINATQMETDGEKESLKINQMESGGEKEGGATQMEYSGGQEDVNDAQMESGGEKESIDIIQCQKNVVDAGEGSKSGEVTQVEYAGGQEGVDITHTETDGEKGGDITQAASDGEKEGVDLIQKEELSLRSAHGLENTHSISENKQNLEIDPDDSRETEKRESAVVKQAEITPKNIQDKPPSKDGSETEVSSMSDGDQNDHVSKQNGDKMVDVKHQITPTSAQTHKRIYPNLQSHLSEENIQDLLKFFHGEMLSWLDFNVGHSDYINNKELAELQDFEQTLEHLLKTRNQEIKPSLQTIHTVLAMLRKKFIPVLADGSVDKSSDPSQTECVNEKCVSTTENRPISEQDTGKDIIMDNNVDNIMDNNMDNSFSINDSDSLISKSLSNDQEVVTDKSRILDAFESDQKTAPQTDTNIITEEFLEPEESQNEGLLHPYTALVAEFTSGALAFVVKESAQVNHVIHEVGTGTRSTVCSFKTALQSGVFFLLCT